MKIFTNKGYQRDLDKHKEEAFRQADEYETRREFRERLCNLEERVDALEGKKRPTNCEPIDPKKPRWKR